MTGRTGYREHIRRCKRCNEFYKTPVKGSKICDKCQKPRHNAKKED